MKIYHYINKLIKRANPFKRSKQSPVVADTPSLRELADEISGTSLLTRDEVESCLRNVVDMLPVLSG